MLGNLTSKLAQCYTSHSFPRLLVFPAFAPLPFNEKILVFQLIFQCPASWDAYSFLESHVVPACLEHLCDSLLAAGWHFLSDGLYSCFASWVSHLAGAIHQPGSQCVVPMQLCRAVAPTRRYMVPQASLHTHKLDTPISSLVTDGFPATPWEAYVAVFTVPPTGDFL